MSSPEGTALPGCPECRASGERVMGHIEPGVYDGVLWWECLACGHIWPRNFGDWERLNQAAYAYAYAASKERKAL